MASIRSVYIILALVLFATIASGQPRRGNRPAARSRREPAARRRNLRAARRRETPQRTVLDVPKILSRTCPRREYGIVKDRIRAYVRSSNDPDRWPGRFLQLGFHDCLPRSCDGSIQFELERVNNIKLKVPINLLKTIIRGTCVGFADAVKIGVELSMEFSGGPRVNCPKGNIADATDANPDDKLPQFDDTFGDIIEDFSSMGFNFVETLAGNYGGHALGGFNAPGTNPPVHVPFTPHPASFRKDFTSFITGNINAPGFNPLPSDITLFSTRRAKRIVRRFASNEWFLRRQFRKFLSKMCSV